MLSTWINNKSACVMIELLQKMWSICLFSFSALSDRFIGYNVGYTFQMVIVNCPGSTANKFPSSIATSIASRGQKFNWSFRSLNKLLQFLATNTKAQPPCFVWGLWPHETASLSLRDRSYITGPEPTSLSLSMVQLGCPLASLFMWCLFTLVVLPL